MNLAPPSHQHTGAEYLAATIAKMFPKAQILGTYVGRMGFYCDFLLNQEINAQFLPDIEQQLLTLLKNGEEIEILEMMPENAGVFLEHSGQFQLAKRVFGAQGNIVPIVKIGEYKNWCAGPVQLNRGELGVLKLVSLEKINDHFRIEGFCSADKKSAKEQAKLIKLAKTRDHISYGRKLQLFEKGELGWFWHPKGEKIRRELTRFWFDLHKNQGFAPISTPKGSFDHNSWFEMQFQGERDFPVQICEMGQIDEPFSYEKGLFGAPHYTHDLATTFCTEEQFEKIFTSSLHFILKWVKIFNLKCRWIEFQHCRKYSSIMHEVLSSHEVALERASLDERLGGPGIEARFIDSLGREWEGAQIFVNQPFKPVCVSHSLFRSLERFIAIMIEHTAGVFPLENLKVGSESDET